MTKHIKLMAEYSAYPLWSLEDESIGPINPEVLPLKQEIILQLMKWAEKYDAQLNIVDPTQSNWFNEQELLEFEKEGVYLWMQLRKELGSEFEVEYFSEKLHKHLRDPSELDKE